MDWMELLKTAQLFGLVCDCSKIRFWEGNEEERSILLKIVANELTLAGYQYLQYTLEK